MIGRKDKGFTLIELLIYTSIFAVIGIVLVSILVIFIRIDVKQTAASEVASQANFILQRIQNLVSNAGFLVVNDNTNSEIDGVLSQPHNYLIIKSREERDDYLTSNDSDSPIVIYKEGDFVKVKQGQGSPSYVSINNLNNDKVRVSELTFTKVSSHPGRDVVLINLNLLYNSQNPQQQVSRSFTLGVSKASAAVFDTSLQPGTSSPAQLDMGTTTNRWRHLFLSGNVSVNGLSTLGTGSDPIVYARHSGSFLFNPPLIAGNSNVTTNIALLGAVAGDQIFLTPPSDLENFLTYIGASTLGGSVNITLHNATSTSVDGLARNWYYFLVR